MVAHEPVSAVRDIELLLSLIRRHRDKTDSGRARDILREHGNYAWLTEKGNLVVLNNGIEFAVTYLVMLLALLFSGGGRYTSVDYYLSRLYPGPR